MNAVKNCVLSDGPNPYPLTAGKVPAIQMRVDDWPWNFLGVLHDMAREEAILERSRISSMMRDIVDANRARLNPPVLLRHYSRITPEAAATINPRVFGQSIPPRPRWPGNRTWSRFSRPSFP